MLSISFRLYPSLTAALQTLRGSKAIFELILLPRVDVVNVAVQAIGLPDPVPLSSCERMRASENVARIPPAGRKRHNKPT